MNARTMLAVGWIVVSTTACAITPDDSDEPDGVTGDGGHGGTDGQSGDGGGATLQSIRTPACMALDARVHPVYATYCEQWHPGLPIASICVGDPPAGQCAAFESYQRYDRMFCCCDPVTDGGCTVHR